MSSDTGAGKSTSDALVSFPVSLSIVYVATVFVSWLPTARKEPHGDSAKSLGPAVVHSSNNGQLCV